MPGSRAAIRCTDAGDSCARAAPASWSPTIRAMEMDGELLSRVRTGDEEAFVMLVARYQQPMLRLARSMVSNQAVAEEAVQDTWLGVVRGIEQFEGRSVVQDLALSDPRQPRPLGRCT